MPHPLRRQRCRHKGWKKDPDGTDCTRPEERKIPLAIKLDRDLAEYLETVENKTATIEDALRRSQGFKRWKKEKEQ